MIMYLVVQVFLLPMIMLLLQKVLTLLRDSQLPSQVILLLEKQLPLITQQETTPLLNQVITRLLQVQFHSTVLQIQLI